MKRRIEIIAIEQTRIIGGNGQSFCPICQQFADLLTTTQAAAIAQVKTESIRRWLVSGKAHGTKTVGGQHRICRNSLFLDFDQKSLFVVNKNKN